MGRTTPSRTSACVCKYEFYEDIKFCFSKIQSSKSNPIKNAKDADSNGSKENLNQNPRRYGIFVPYG